MTSYIDSYLPPTVSAYATSACSGISDWWAGATGSVSAAASHTLAHPTASAITASACPASASGWGSTALSYASGAWDAFTSNAGLVSTDALGAIGIAAYKCLPIYRGVRAAQTVCTEAELEARYKGVKAADFRYPTAHPGTAVRMRSLASGTRTAEEDAELTLMGYAYGQKQTTSILCEGPAIPAADTADRLTGWQKATESVAGRHVTAEVRRHAPFLIADYQRKIRGWHT